MSPSMMGNAQALDVLLNNVDSLELKKLVPSPSPLLWISSAIQTDNQDFEHRKFFDGKALVMRAKRICHAVMLQDCSKS